MNKIKLNFLTHIKYYTALLFIQIIGFFVMLSLYGNKELQAAVIISSGIGYVSWAILHQYYEHSLTTKIVVEYALFGTFGMVVSLIFFK